MSAAPYHRVALETMRPFVIGLAFCLALFLPDAAPARAGVVSADHDLSVRLLPGGRLEGVDDLKLEITDESSLFLSLSRSAQVEAVQLDGRRIHHSFSGGMLYVHLPPERRTGRIRLAVRWSGVFNDDFEERPVSLDNPGQGVEGTITPEGAFLLPGAGWYPEIEADKRLFSVAVRAPRGMYAVTQGALLGHEDLGSESTSRWRVERPVGGLALQAGFYVVGRTRVGSTDVYAYFTLPNRGLLDRYLDAAARHIDFYTGLFGPYPFEKFAVVENFFPTGFGFPSFTSLGSAVLRLPFIPETSLMHEIAHCWWGNGVLVDAEEGNWSEGLTTYLSDYLAQERLSPKAGIEYRLGVLRDYASLAAGERDFPLSAFGSRSSPASQVIGYGKGMFVFHMIRRHIGDDAFWKGLRLVLEERMYQPASWEDFREAFVRVSTWDEVESDIFFSEWVDRSGAPSLRLAPPSVTAKGDGKSVVAVVSQQARPYYHLSLPVAVETASGTRTKTLLLDEEQGRVELRVQGEPRRLTVDPDADVFKLLTPDEVPPTVNSVRGAGRLVVVTASSLAPAQREVCGTLLAALGRKSEVPVDEDRTDGWVGRGENVLFCGQPETPTWRARLSGLPSGLRLSPGGFIVPGKQPVAEGEVLFAVFPSAARDGTFTAGLFPSKGATAQAVIEAARKIPHYGKSSWVVFRDGKGTLKGSFEASSSPLTVRFGAER